MTGPERTGPEQTGPEQTGPEQTGPEQTGPEQTGPDARGRAVDPAEEAQRTARAGGRLRALGLLLLLAAAGTLFFALSLPWFTIELLAAPGERFEATGQQAAAPLAPVAVALLALVAALALAGPVFRHLLGVLAVAIGAAAGAITLLVLRDPVIAVTGAVSERTGVAGAESVSAMVAAISATGSGLAAAAAAGLAAVAGVFVFVTARFWPVGGDRYRRAAFADAQGEPVLDWDSISRGEDPTGDAGPTGDASPSRGRR